ncbi:MAG TPA: XRE family transcriptional regulator [Vicinamibacteria bacterium]|nr:XRE family transcriptional regulator [Vicinamibacteria bacterium]
MRLLKQQVVGQRVRSLRQAAGMTLRTLATQTDFSPSFISQVENGLVSPSISSMEKIAGALGVTLGQFFSPSAEGDAVLIVRAAARTQAPSLWSHAHLEPLSPAREDRRFEPVLIVMEPGGRSSKHPVAPGREEFVYVLAGSLVLTLGPDEHVMGPGDAVTIRAQELRRWENRSKKNARFLVVASRAV